MPAFLAAFFFFTGLMLVFSLPMLVRQCEDAGGLWWPGGKGGRRQFTGGGFGQFRQIVSIALTTGRRGLHLLFVVGYIVTSWVKAVMIIQE